MASSIMALKSSAVMVESTSFMASFSAVLPFSTEMPMLTFSPLVDLEVESPSVPEKSRIVRSS